jgi:hypothetical protein
VLRFTVKAEISAFHHVQMSASGRIATISLRTGDGRFATLNGEIQS